MDNDELFRQADEQYDLGNLEGAFKLFLEAAEQGDISAMSRLAMMYGAGEGAPQDVEKSIEWDLKSIELGDSISMLNLGITYRMKGDILKTKYWFERALAAGDGEAALQLAKLYMVSDKEQKNIRYYLNVAINHDSINEMSQEEACELLTDFKNV